MKEYFDRLTLELMNKNKNLTENQARTFVELLWEDFETTYAKAGRTYRGPNVTERIVRQWIDNYGSRLHEFAATNPKYAHLLKNIEH